MADTEKKNEKTVDLALCIAFFLAQLYWASERAQLGSVRGARQQGDTKSNTPRTYSDDWLRAKVCGSKALFRDPTTPPWNDPQHRLCGRCCHSSALPPRRRNDIANFIHEVGLLRVCHFYRLVLWVNLFWNIDWHSGGFVIIRCGANIFTIHFNPEYQIMCHVYKQF